MKFEINWTKIRGGCQLGRKVVTHNSKSDLPLEVNRHFQDKVGWSEKVTIRKKGEWPKTWVLPKNPQFLSNFYETC